MKDVVLEILAVLLLFGGYLFSNIIYSTLGFLTLVYLTSLYLSFNPKLQIELKNTYFEINDDESLTLKFFIKNKGGIPLKIIPIKNSSDFDWHFDDLILNKFESRDYEIKLSPKSKGHFEIDEIIFKISNLSEVYSTHKKIDNKIVIDVYPSPKSISKGVRGYINIMAGEELLRAIKMGVRSPEVDVVREFLPGDGIKDIDWKKSLIRGKIFVKEFLREFDGDVYILVDIDNKFKRKIIDKSRTDYLFLILSQLLYMLKKSSNRNVKVVLFDDFGIKKVVDVDNVKHTLKNIISFMESPKGYPNLKTYIKKINVKSPLFRITEDFTKIAYEIDNGVVFLITDAGMRFDEIYNFSRMIKGKNSNLYVISLNPFLFIDIDGYDEESIKKIVALFKERENTVKALNSVCPTVDLGPNDILSLCLGGKHG